MELRVIRFLDSVSLHPGYDHNQNFSPSANFSYLRQSINEPSKNYFGFIWSFKKDDLNALRLEVYTLFMPVNLPLKNMTIHEKLAAMELLWEDLARSPESIESPTWHKDTLDERRQLIAEGKSQFTDWETAKTEIRKKLP